MAFDVSGLSLYVDQEKNELIRRSLMTSRTLGNIQVQPGIKHSASINILTGNDIFQSGSCGWSASGDTAMTQRDITVCDIKKNEALCLNDLEKYYTSKAMAPGSYNETIPFEALYAEEVVGQTAKFVEKLSWQGDVALASSNNLSLCDGLLKVIDAEASVVSVTGEALTAAGIVDAIDAMVDALPEDVAEATDLKVFLSISTFRTYLKALRDANLYAFDGSEQASFTIPYYNSSDITIVGVGGIPAGRAVLAESQNLVAGTDLLSDAEDFKIFYSEDNDEVRVRLKMKIGFQVAFPARIVEIGG
tara:strand:- start:919 stop:1830 length:912 start_codon:yes stop_codon:yes gene_type:complete